MKTRPIIVTFLVVIAVVVSVGSARVIGRVGRHEVAARSPVSQAELARGVATGVAKVAVRMLVCRQ